MTRSLNRHSIRLSTLAFALSAILVDVGTCPGQDASAPRNGRGQFTPSFNELPKNGTEGSGDLRTAQNIQIGQQTPPPRDQGFQSNSINPSGNSAPPAAPPIQPPQQPVMKNNATQIIQNPNADEKRINKIGDQVVQGQGQWQQHVPGAGRSGSAGPNVSTGGFGQNIPQDITQVSKTFSALPSDGGQVWREYDIRPYTMQIADSEKPEQAIVDWILKQTGTEMWFNHPLGILSATRDKVIVYHTPEIHNEIKPIIDRFNYTRGQKVSAQVNLVTVGNPNWRETAYPYLQPIEVNSPQIEAWLVTRENAALLLNQLGRRSDYRDHASGTMTIANGQKLALRKETPTQFLRSLRWTPGQATPVQPIMAQVNEGYSLAISLLTALDGKSIESSITCNLDQIEKFTPVRVPTSGQAPSGPLLRAVNGSNESVQLQVPQFVSWRLHERIRWPVDQVLVVSCGVVATPDSETSRAGGGLSNLINRDSRRADALLFVDYRGTLSGASTSPSAANVPDYMRPIAPK